MADCSQNNLPVAVRFNPFKCEDFPSNLEVEDAVPWSPNGAYLKQRPSFTLDPLFHAGLYYVQDPSAMMVGWMLRQVLERGYACSKVLDLCAAPGGKTTDISASLREMGDRYLLVANEVIHARALTLQDNVARWGDPNIVVSNSDPRDFSRLNSFFDIIVADVPCSGEGMFRKSENARQMWSEENVQMCASRQRRILADAWASLREGGVLIYSTCTLNDDENDANVAWIAQELGAEVLRFDMPFDGPKATQYGFLMVPGEVRGEGQYCAALVKDGAPRAASKDDVSSQNSDSEGIGFFNRGDEIYAVPDYVASQMSFVGKKINVLNAGVHAFTMKGKDRIPSADLALSTVLSDDDFPDVSLDLKDALRFLHKDAIVLRDAPLGYVTVSYLGHRLGFMKNLGNRANNLHPAPRRILMNVE